MNDDEAMEDLIRRILEVTKSPESTAFYGKAIGLLGAEVVEMELAEVRYRALTKQVDSPARYLTALLKKRLGELEPQGGLPAVRSNELQSSYFSPSQLSLFMELKPSGPTVDEPGTDKAMPIPYSKSGIPWVTFIGPDFFTLSTNRAKSDMVTAKFRSMDGQTTAIPVIRGRLFPEDDERGIPTVEHGRILGALESIWIQEGCKYTKFGNGMVSCCCNVSIRELARLLGCHDFGGSQLRHLKRRVADLKVMPYYLDLEAVKEFKDAGLKGYGFTLVGDITLLDKKGDGSTETIIRISFSETFSRQLLARRTVSRPREMLTHRSELAFLLRLYLEPILIGRSGETYEIALTKLIENLSLPPANWHRVKSKRKQQFGKALRELNGRLTADGKTISVRMDPGKNNTDFLLVAQLIKGALPLSQ